MYICTYAATTVYLSYQMYALLEKWQQLTPETAMELLDYQYADIAVRNFAVMCLEVLR